MFDIPLAFAFSAGVAAAFNPCGAAMFPAYVGYQLDTATVERHPLASGIRGFIMGLAVTAGFLVVFGGVGLILALGGRLVGKFLPFLGLGVGIAIMALGLWLIISRRKIGIVAASRVDLGEGKGVRHVFLFGIAYAIASLSCALPIYLAAVGIVIGQTLSAATFVDTVVASVTYGIGMGSILMATTLGVVFFKELVQKGMRKIFPLIEPIGNLAMVGAGAYVVYYWTFGSGSELLRLRAAEIF